MVSYFQLKQVIRAGLLLGGAVRAEPFQAEAVVFGGVGARERELVVASEVAGVEPF